MKTAKEFYCEKMDVTIPFDAVNITTEKIFELMESYHAQFTQPITEEEIEKAYYMEYGKSDVSSERMKRFVNGAKWAIERMKKDDRELLVKFSNFSMYGNEEHYSTASTQKVDEFLNSNK